MTAIPLVFSVSASSWLLLATSAIISSNEFQITQNTETARIFIAKVSKNTDISQVITLCIESVRNPSVGHLSWCRRNTQEKYEFSKAKQENLSFYLQQQLYYSIFHTYITKSRLFPAMQQPRE